MSFSSVCEKTGHRLLFGCFLLLSSRSTFAVMCSPSLRRVFLSSGTVSSSSSKSELSASAGFSTSDLVSFGVSFAVSFTSCVVSFTSFGVSFTVSFTSFAVISTVFALRSTRFGCVSLPRLSHLVHHLRLPHRVLRRLTHRTLARRHRIHMLARRTRPAPLLLSSRLRLRLRLRHMRRRHRSRGSPTCHFLSSPTASPRSEASSTAHSPLSRPRSAAATPPPVRTPAPAAPAPAASSSSSVAAVDAPAGSDRPGSPRRTRRDLERSRVAFSPFATHSP